MPPEGASTPHVRNTGERTLEALADGVDEAHALEGFAWSVPRASRLRRRPAIEPALARLRCGCSSFGDATPRELMHDGRIFLLT